MEQNLCAQHLHKTNFAKAKTKTTNGSHCTEKNREMENVIPWLLNINNS